MTGSSLVATAKPSGAVAAWLLLCCALVFCMVVVGGVTRLTHSGLSITEWQPIVGTLPPLSDADWQAAFDKYKLTPEYRDVNRGMTLAAFKGIFWWEYFHRLLGRLIGVAFLLPFVWSRCGGRSPRASGEAPRHLRPRRAQGRWWYMVQSGLVDDPRVSQFRLTAHRAGVRHLRRDVLVALSLLERRASSAAAGGSVFRFAVAVAALVRSWLTGGMVAGIRAGFAYNTFPLMNGAFVPPELFMLEPWWKNFFWNMATVQFDHRLVAYALVAAVGLCGGGSAA
jgi:cytochrome c oxidase assembly protein subunit 15